ncbi:MAG: carbamoyltransferase C-terminal domain-containing protein [bacterium]|nr:carbamoyltransferase C-terminal domain-containing protein [bacterium]
MRKERKQVVVGLNTGHDGGAAIIVDGDIIYSISEERLNRRRYSHGYLQSFFYCLNAANLTISDISLIVFSSYGKTLPTGYQGDLSGLGISSTKFIYVDHHLSHAYSSYFLSSFDEALVVILDGEGNDNCSESYYIGKGKKLKKIGGNNQKRSPAKGIGRTYESFTNFLGWTDQEAGKTMGLAAFANTTSIKTPLFTVKDTKVSSLLEEKYEKGTIDFVQKYHLPFGKPYNRGMTKGSKLAAAYVQKQTEVAIIELIKQLVKKTKKTKLCLCGGVALNSSTNAKLIQEKIIEDIFILPAASDRGQALGNAIYGYHKLSGDMPKFKLQNDYFGKEYTKKEILDALQRKDSAHVKKKIPRKNIVFKKQKNIVKATAQLIANGKIIGWFQGGSELGPRALGHRSIICDPRSSAMKDILNKRVKHREKFRPFAPSCLAEYASEFFNWSIPSPYMLFVVPIKKEYVKTIPAVRHVDGTARLQTVTKKGNGIYYDLIKEFHKLTGIPIVLNTSFNDNEPIVETPGDAVATFLSTDIDFLAIGDYLAWKK